MLRALRSPFSFSLLRAIPASVFLLSMLVLPALAKPATPSDSGPGRPAFAAHRLRRLEPERTRAGKHRA